MLYGPIFYFRKQLFAYFCYYIYCDCFFLKEKVAGVSIKFYAVVLPITCGILMLIAETFYIQKFW
jgi:hypothetical protein